MHISNTAFSVMFNDLMLPVGVDEVLSDSLEAHNILARIVVVTPSLARNWLGLKPTQTIFASKRELARIANHGWQVTNEIIAFDKEARLVTGAERLKAGVASNTAFVALVVCGVGVHKDDK